jgi:hypothetical protein
MVRPSWQGFPNHSLTAHAVGTTGSSGSPYVVTHDGQRFLVLAASDEKAPSSPIDVVVNWR